MKPGRLDGWVFLQALLGFIFSPLPRKPYLNVGQRNEELVAVVIS